MRLAVAVSVVVVVSLATATATRHEQSKPRLARPLQARVVVAELQTTASTVEQGFVAELNRIRAEHGLGRVVLDDALSAAAREHSADMVARHYFAHGVFWRRLERVGATYGTVGEVLGWTSRVDGAVRVLTRMWMRSGEHRVVVLNPRYRAVGVGVVVGRFEGERDALVVTADFWSR